MNRFSAALLAALMSCMPLAADTWPAWRGPDHNGISPARDLPARWDADTHLRWRLALPGPAPSTPAIWGERIFLTSADGEALLLMAVATDGTELWRIPAGDGNRDIRQGESNAAAPSPVTDGEHVWAFFGTGVLLCATADGSEIWRTDLQDRYGEFRMYWGMATSPLLKDGRLYLQLMHDNAQLLLALDAATGEEVWTHRRQTDARDENLHSYASLIPFAMDGETYLIAHGADYVTAHRIDGGEEVWRSGGLQDPGNYNSYLRFVATPVTAPGLIVVPSAKNGPVLGIDPEGARGDITHSGDQFHWKLSNSTTDVPSPLIHEGLVYILRENGVLLCLDAKTGELVYQESVYRRRHRASPVYADGKLYLTAMDGTVNVVKAGRDYAMLATNKFEEHTAASPAIADGVIYFRTEKALYAIGGDTE